MQAIINWIIAVNNRRETRFAEDGASSSRESTIMATFAAAIDTCVVKSSTGKTAGNVAVAAIVYRWNMGTSRFVSRISSVTTLAVSCNGRVNTGQERRR